VSGLGHDAGELTGVSVVVVCHDRLDEVVRNVPRRISDVRQHGLELVVVDNASHDGTQEWLTARHAEDPCFALVLNEQNLGVGAGRNSGWARTTGRIIITHDEDAEVRTDQLLALVAALDASESAGIVHPIPVNEATDSPQISIQPPPHHATNFHGSCYAIRRSVVTAVGMHDPDCDFGGEELDLSIRARAAGWEVLQVPSVRFVHRSLRRPGAIGRWRRERWIQNHARVVWRWFPARNAVPWSIIMLLAEVRGAASRRQFASVPGLARAWLGGVMSGVALHDPVPASVVHFYSRRLGLIATVRRLTLRP